MRKSIGKMAAKFMAAGALVFVLAAAAAAQAQLYVADEVLVGLQSGRQVSVTSVAVPADVGRGVQALTDIGVVRVKLAPGLTVDQAIARLRGRPGIAFVEPNMIMQACAAPNDPYYATNQYGPQKMQADMVWSMWSPVTTTVVAIADTGVDGTHPDLTNKMLRDASGIVGYNAFTLTRSDAVDDKGHGTHCAGIVAAQINNGVGIAGMAGWSGSAVSTDTTYTKIMPVKVLDSAGNGTTTTVANGITWAADNGAKVISLSLSGGSATTLSTAVSHAWGKGCLVVAAAGNSGVSTITYPAGYANVISVAATTKTDTLATYSNYGSWVTIAAPGGNAISTDTIVSTLPTYTNPTGLTNYGGMSGTSMAAPHVAGEAALVWSAYPALTNAQVRSYILSNTDAVLPYLSRTIGGGRANALKAYQAASGLPTAPLSPTALTATGGKAMVTLKWTQSKSTGVTQNRIYRALKTGGPYTLVKTITAATTTTDTGLASRTSYYYVVTAVNSSSLESPYSNQATAKTR